MVKPCTPLEAEMLDFLKAIAKRSTIRDSLPFSLFEKLFKLIEQLDPDWHP